MISKLAPESIDFADEFEYGRKFCNGKKNAFGWDFSGASNMPELSNRIKEKFMLRVRKSDVLKELPPKIEELIFIADNAPGVVESMERDILKHYSPADLAKGQIMQSIGKNEGEDLHISTYRKLLGLHKAPYAVEFIKECLEDNDESFIVFAIHTDVIAALREGLASYKPIVITGATPPAKRVPMVKEFQASSSRRLLRGNIQAAGIGLNATKASRVIYVEFSWCDKDNEQAADRAHRIGQVNRVLVQYLVFRNSLDRRVMEVIFRKRKIGGYV
jgi:SWI/SNF-related matrix-associated actin-dependent regulator 1 of chromatin subfamily A